jgi:hypothetical protein
MLPGGHPIEGAGGTEPEGGRRPKRSASRGEARARIISTCQDESPADRSSIALLKVFTNGIVDDRINKAAQLLTDDNLTANEKLTEIDALIRFPPTASAEQLGEMLGVSKQAVLKTDWWIQNRKGEKADETGRRRAVHQRRAKESEPPDARDSDDPR